MTTLTDSGQGMDVAIGGHGFKLAISKDQPYERATAQFRKEQFDAAPTVGDQSLAGWWTRGQMSFHRGAGVKYYEVLDGDEVLNRFQSSTGIDPWEPGEMVLSGALTTVALASIRDAVGATYGASDGVIASVGDYTLRFVNAALGAMLYASNYSDVLAITTSGTDTYVCTANAIEGPAAAPVAMGTNLIRNPKFYAAGDMAQVGGFSNNGGAVPVATFNNGYLTYTVTDGVDQNGATVFLTGLTIGQTYRVVLANDASSQPAVWYLDGDALTGTYLGTVNAGTTGVVSFTATAASHDLYACGGSNGVTRRWNSLAVTTDRADASNSPGFNPIDNPDYVWTGATHNSAQTRSVATGDPTALWLPPSGRAWAGAWWAKGRLFAIDDEGKWYTLSTVGGTASEVDDVFWSPALGATGWSLCESPAAVYISRGTDIYKITLDDAGAVPVITTPVVAASLPTGETISTIYAYLGRMAICTSRGLRVALVDSDSGSLIYGPRVVEGDFSDCVRVTALGDLAYVVGTADDAATPSLYAVNMADNDDLNPAWAEVRPVATGTLFGATVTPDGKVMTWDGGGFFRSTSGYVTEGSVLTGFHRLGTLEAKSFQYLLVITEGTVGTVEVEAVLPDGTTATVGTVDAGDSTQLALGTAVPTPQSYIALRFTLNGDGSDTPILLGYQIKALPAPTRQRMIRVPLLLMDNERGGNGAPASGYDGSAWDRLDALETMEASGGVHDWQDFRTGETGTVFIESVEHRGTTAPSSMDDGFGGIVWLTLRKID